ncbi:MAG: glycogen debranching enzyme GlgX [Ilumatobacter coccineus]|uniref:Glycogen debranching enzyme GlgX n=1 Tax=Ilumatobacter coccineus TaxID=467094 RepID=A0A2G6KBA0_9ACTN|nr:MAG: glycogen debranching enzyme GlgX [Ilumatobacter coccineus]
MHRSVIYETHVRGMTMTHPGIPDELRGTYSGLAHPIIIEHLLRLGITAIELMPVHHFVSEERLHRLGLTNYWGYNSLAYFAPHDGYASGAGSSVLTEFKSMVKAFHAAGLEVILDVVYNHTAEGDHLGPTLSMRGIDNRAYYRVHDDNPSRYLDFTGCGNSMNMRHPHVLQLIMDSLRYWHLEMRVDGFRFDLASALARELYDVDRLSSFFDVVHQDPTISQVKLIAEPWDVGEGGYQVGNFPAHWSEWNGKYRDTVRDFWRGDPSTLAELGNRLTGSSDLYEADTRRPTASINFVTCHDGFTLRDLVSYNHKHNDTNGENGHDGETHNRSWNCGVEGPTDNPEIAALRARQQRNMIATVMLSQGVPMLLGGDEIGRTQHGNNNAYCHDDAVSWFDWDNTDTEILDWTRRLIHFRHDHPVFRRRRWFHGRQIRGVSAIAWFRPDGEPMTDADWWSSFAKSVAVFVNGESIRSTDIYGKRVVDDSFLMIVNASEVDLDWHMPTHQWTGQAAQRWLVELDSNDPQIGDAITESIPGNTTRRVANRSLVLLRAIPH